MNISSFNFNSIRIVTEAKLNISSSQNSTIISYKLDTVKDGKIMSQNIFKILFVRISNKRLDLSKIVAPY